MPKIRLFTSTGTYPFICMITVSSTIDSTIYLQKAESLAAKLGLPFCQNPDEFDSSFLLAYTKDGLCLLARSSNGKRLLKQLFVDFLYGKNNYRLQNNLTSKQPIAKAVGIRPGYRPNVFDATAGLGGDSFVIASLGCKVTMSERSPVIHALLSDGLERAKLNGGAPGDVAANMKLLEGDSHTLLADQAGEFATIYLDPMYPHRSKSALNSQAMRAIRCIAGDDNDSGKLLELALQCATDRVTVKRPKMAPPLSDQPCSHSIFMKSSRYDIYLVR